MAIGTDNKNPLKVIRFTFPLWQQDYWEDRFFLATKGDYLLYYKLNEEAGIAECHIYPEKQKQSYAIKMRNILKGWGFNCE